jgi:hypothetical protein
MGLSDPLETGRPTVPSPGREKRACEGRPLRYNLSVRILFLLAFLAVVVIRVRMLASRRDWTCGRYP